MIADWARRGGVALWRGAVLAALAVVGLALTVVSLVVRIVAIMALVAPQRRFADACRALAGRWSDVVVPSPYLPRPPPGERWWSRAQNYLEWIDDDPATGRDDTWLMLNGPVGVVLGAGPLAMIAGGCWAAATAPTWLAAAGSGPGGWGAGAVAAAVTVLGAAVAVALTAAPVLVRLHAWWTRSLLAPVTRRLHVSAAWALLRCVALVGTSALALALFVFQAAAIVASFGLGLVVLLAPAIESTRWLPRLRRGLAREWAEVMIDEPYRPPPGPAERGPDGRYRDDHGVTYKTAIASAWSRRFTWAVTDPATWRDFAWALLNPVVVVVVAGAPVLAVVAGAARLSYPSVLRMIDPSLAVSWEVAAFAQRPWAGIVLGAVLIGVGFTLTRPAARWIARWDAVLLRPTSKARLALEVRRLAETRANSVEAQAAELRRIERDLHDGAQARMVAVGMAIAVAETLIDTDPAAAKSMLAQARESQSHALTELRNLVRGIHPPVLAERGLADAVRALALDSQLPVAVHAPDAVDVPAAVAAAAYFATAEAITNAVRHADASTVEVRLARDGPLLRVTVTDDGRGGADPSSGTGLRGVERRLAAFDGTLSVVSPPGGPTTLTMEVPCASSSPRTSPFSAKG